MIEAKELRLGNYIDIDYAPQTKITLDLFKAIGEGVYNEEDLHPIPLTPEILEKCGFKKNKLGNLFKKVRNKIDGFKSELHLSDYFEERTYYYSLPGGIKITTLHQLQNLYFALTGEEIEIEL